jgi:uncharacterized protein (DUF2062 family)
MRGWIRTAVSTLRLINDSPHRIALGMALGLLVSWTPTVGLQTLFVVPIAWAIRANPIAAVIGIYLSNPLTMIPMYWLEYEVGNAILDSSIEEEDVEALWAAGTTAEFAQAAAQAGWQVWLAMWAGGLVLGIVSSIAGYFATHWLVVKTRSVKLSEVPDQLLPSPESNSRGDERT